MNELKPILRLLVMVQIFLLFMVIFLPFLVHLLQGPGGRFLYVILSLFGIVQALLLRRVLAQLT